MFQNITRPYGAGKLLTRLEGNWIGEGQGGFPTISHFAYRETLSIVRYDERSLFYRQQTEKQLERQNSFARSHWESGFLRLLDDGRFELSNCQSGGRCELLVGSHEKAGDTFRLHLASREIINDGRMVNSARTSEVGPDRLQYEMRMQTTRVTEQAVHLSATLLRTAR